MNCSKCGEDNQVEAKFCNKCGASLKYNPSNSDGAKSKSTSRLNTISSVRKPTKGVAKYSKKLVAGAAVAVIIVILVGMGIVLVRAYRRSEEVKVKRANAISVCRQCYYAGKELREGESCSNTYIVKVLQGTPWDSLDSEKGVPSICEECCNTGLTDKRNRGSKLKDLLNRFE